MQTEEKSNSGASKLELFLESQYFIAVIVVLVAIIAFSLGRLSKIEQGREPVRVLNTNQEASANMSSNSAKAALNDRSDNGIVVGSKSGTKYHLPTCPGAKQISEKNRITFNSIEEARAKGYTPATNCKGLK